MTPDSNSWQPPVIFHFSVEFQWGNDKASASFAEVDGLGQELVLDKEKEHMELPVQVKGPDLTLKRALEPLNEKITVWIKNTFRFLYGARIKPCTMLVSLLDGQNKVVAAWVCEWTFPVKWTMSSLDASGSKIAIETITLRYKSLRRNK